MDVSSDSVYLFLTDYTDSSNDQLSNFAPADNSTTPAPTTLLYKGAGCYIVRYYVNTFTFKVLVAGNFLNFSKTHPIINVNLLENLLFFTDNRNRSEEHTSELQSHSDLVCRLLLEKKKKTIQFKYK